MARQETDKLAGQRVLSEGKQTKQLRPVDLS
jgi:hypothetical protein